MFVSWILKSLFLDFFFFLIGLRHPYPVMKYSKDQKYSVMKNKKKEKRKKELQRRPNGFCDEEHTQKKKKVEKKKEKEKKRRVKSKVAASGSLSVCLIMKMPLEI